MEQQRLGALETGCHYHPNHAPFHSHAQDRWQCFGLTMAACDSLNISQHRLYDITFRGVEQSCQVFLGQYSENRAYCHDIIKYDQIFAMIMPYALISFWMWDHFLSTSPPFPVLLWTGSCLEKAPKSDAPMPRPPRALDPSNPWANIINISIFYSIFVLKCSCTYVYMYVIIQYVTIHIIICYEYVEWSEKGWERMKG